MSIITVCRLTDQSDVVIKRHGWCRYEMSINRFSIAVGFVHPNAWPKHMKTHYTNITWTSVRSLIREAEEHGLHIPKHCKEYFDYQTFPGRVACWLRSIFN